MDIHILHNKGFIYKYLIKNKKDHFYTIGDLDDFFWTKTIWYGLMDKNEIKSIALLYIGTGLPTLLLFYEDEYFFAEQLVSQLKPILPTRFYVHLTTGLMELFGRENLIKDFGLHLKMTLKRRVSDPGMDCIRRLTIEDLAIMNAFYKVAYPNNWFDSRMLETNKYFGYFANDKLVGVSGVHSFSRKYKVAAIGNVATHPDFRNQGIGYKITAALCSDLQKDIKLIGLNVHLDNRYAIYCYQKIGFEIVASFNEGLIKNDLLNKD